MTHFSTLRETTVLPAPARPRFEIPSPGVPPSRLPPKKSWYDNALGGMRWISLFFTMAKAATLLAQILAARFLGPTEYGIASLVLAVSALVQILPLLGFHLALSHFIPLQENDSDRTRLISTVLSACAVWAGLCLVFLLAIPPTLLEKMGLSQSIWGYSLLLAFLNAGHLIVCASLQGFTWFKKRGLAETLYGCTALALLLGAAWSGMDTFHILIGSLVGGFIISTGYGLWQLRRYVRLTVFPKQLRGITSYALMGTLTVLAAALIQAPARICLFHFMAPETAGIYSAYFTATAQVSLALIMMIWTVLIPLSSHPEDQREAWRHSVKMIPPLAALAMVFFLATGFAGIMIVGKEYPLRWSWLVLFSASASVIMVQGIFSALFAARGVRGLRISATGALISGLGNFCLNLILTPRWGITGAALSLLSGYMMALLWFWSNQPAAEEAADPPACAPDLEPSC